MRYEYQLDENGYILGWGKQYPENEPLILCGEYPEPLPEMSKEIGAHLDEHGNPKYRLVKKKKASPEGIAWDIILDPQTPTDEQAKAKEREKIVTAIRKDTAIDDELALLWKAVEATGIKLPEECSAFRDKVKVIKDAK